MSKNQDRFTLKPRKLELSLSDEDAENLCRKAGQAGITISKLVEAFIADLVDGINANGSDERMYLEAWYNRCWFSMFPERKFVSFLLSFGEMEEFLEAQEDKKSAAVCISKIEKNFQNSDYPWQDLYYIKKSQAQRVPCYKNKEDWVRENQNDLEQEEECLLEAEQRIAHIWEDYLDWTGRKDHLLECHLEELEKYISMCQSFKGETNV